MKVPAPLSTEGEPCCRRQLGEDPATPIASPGTASRSRWSSPTPRSRRDYAASLVRVDYDAEKAVTSFEAAIAQAKTPKEVLGESPEVADGDPDAALRSAAHAVD